MTDTGYWRITIPYTEHEIYEGIVKAAIGAYAISKFLNYLRTYHNIRFELCRTKPKPILPMWGEVERFGMRIRNSYGGTFHDVYAARIPVIVQ